MPKLSDKPARTDLTDRECSRIIGGVLGGLAGLTDLQALRRAVRWWAETDEAWKLFEEQERAMRQSGLSPKREEGG
jgi:hypothetical protein